MLGAPYALADSMNLDISNDTTGIIPIVLKTRAKNILKTFHVALILIDTKQNSITENSENSSGENYTEVQILLPYNDSGDDSTLYGLLPFLRSYSALNTHITFNFTGGGKHMNFPATQPMIKSDNKSSIHFYELHEFRQMVKDLSNKKDTFYDMFQRNFKSANNLPKNDLTMMTLGELSKSNEKIEEIFKLRDRIQPFRKTRIWG